MAKELFYKEQNIDDIIEKKRKIDENKSIRKPVELPTHLQTHEESLNFTS